MKNLFSAKLQEQEREILEMWRTYQQITSNIFLWTLCSFMAMLAGYMLPLTVIYILTGEIRPMPLGCFASSLAALLIVKSIKNRFPSMAEIEEVISKQEKDIERELKVPGCIMNVEEREYYLLQDDCEVMFDCEEEILAEYVGWLKKALELKRDFWKICAFCGLLVIVFILGLICIGLSMMGVFIDWIGNITAVLMFVLGVVTLWWTTKWGEQCSASDDEMLEKVEATFSGRLPDVHSDFGKLEILGWRMEPDFMEILEEKVELGASGEIEILLKRDEVKVRLLVGYVVRF